MRWLDNIPWDVLIVVSIILGLAPFTPEPHLVEKIRMLFQGSLSRPLDIFDLFLHGIFPLLLLLKTTDHVHQHLAKSSSKDAN